MGDEAQPAINAAMNAVTKARQVPDNGRRRACCVLNLCLFIEASSIDLAWQVRSIGSCGHHCQHADHGLPFVTWQRVMR